MATRIPNPVQACVGLAILMAGLGGMAALMFVIYGDSAACQAWALRLGITLTLLLSAIAQAMMLLGGWLLWRAARAP